MSSTKLAKTRQKTSKKLAFVDVELCGICQGCATVCPVNAIDVLENQAQVIPGKCTGCGICIKVCPVGAITLVER
ncbi:MAG: 4Fe-4S dicluster domain-containing protein [Promethearchaeota archaeon]